MNFKYSVDLLIKCCYIFLVYKKVEKTKGDVSMKKLKTLLLTAVTGFSIACTPLMAAPYFSQKSIQKVYELFDRSDKDILNLVKIISPEACSILIACVLENIKAQEPNYIAKYCSKIGRGNVPVFSRTWLEQADRDEINREMLYIFWDVEYFDKIYFQININNLNLRDFPHIYEHIKDVLIAIRKQYIDYYSRKVKKADKKNPEDADEWEERTFKTKRDDIFKRKLGYDITAFTDSLPLKRRMYFPENSESFFEIYYQLMEEDEQPIPEDDGLIFKFDEEIAFKSEGDTTKKPAPFHIPGLFPIKSF